MAEWLSRWLEFQYFSAPDETRGQNFQTSMAQGFFVWAMAVYHRANWYIRQNPEDQKYDEGQINRKPEG